MKPVDEDRNFTYSIVDQDGNGGCSYIPNTLGQVQDFAPVHEVENIFMPGSEVVWADYPALQRDFPFLQGLDQARIDEWVVENFAFMAKPQLKLNGIHQLDIPHNEVRKISYRQRFHTKIPGKHTVHDQGRADLIPALDFNGNMKGFVDRKGVGVDEKGVLRNQGFLKDLGLEGLRMRAGANGLMLLGHAILEVAMIAAVQRYLEYANNHSQFPIETIGYYFILRLPFEGYVQPGQMAPAALIGRQAHIGRVWTGEVMHPGKIHTKQFDFFLSAADPDTVRIKDPVFDEVRALVSHQRDGTDLPFFSRGANLSREYMRTKDRGIVTDFIRKVQDPVVKMMREKGVKPARAPRHATVEEAMDRLLTLIESDPRRYHRFAETLVWSINRGSVSRFDTKRMAAIAEKLLALPFEVDELDLLIPRRYGVFLLPVLPELRRRHWLEREIQDPQSLPFLAKMIWMLPFAEGQPYLDSLIATQGELLEQAIDNKLDQPDVAGTAAAANVSRYKSYVLEKKLT